MNGFQGFNVPGFNLAFPQYRPQESGLSSLASAIQDISQAQRQRRMDEDTLRQRSMQRQMEEMKLQEEQRSRAAEADVSKVFQTAFAPEAPSTKPIGPDTEAYDPDEAEIERIRNTIPMLLHQGSPEARKAAEMLDTKMNLARQTLDIKRMQAGVAQQRVENQQTQATNVMRLKFLNSPEGLRGLANYNQKLFSEFFPDADPDEVAKAPVGTPFQEYDTDVGKIIYYTDPNGRKHIVSKPTAQMYNSRDPDVRNFIIDMARMRGTRLITTAGGIYGISPDISGQLNVTVPNVVPSSGVTVPNVVPPPDVTVPSPQKGPLNVPGMQEIPVVPNVSGPLPMSLQPGAPKVPVAPQELPPSPLQPPVKAATTIKDLENIRKTWDKDLEVKAFREDLVNDQKARVVEDKIMERAAKGESIAMEQITQMYSYIRALDNSVVKPTEFDTFRAAADDLFTRVETALTDVNLSEEQKRVISLDASKRLMELRRGLADRMSQLRQQKYAQFEANFGGRYKDMLGDEPLIPAPWLNSLSPAPTASGTAPLAATGTVRLDAAAEMKEVAADTPTPAGYMKVRKDGRYFLTPSRRK